MNQFNNIGSMFPGAEHRLTREKAKHVLTMGVNFEITGLVMTDKITGDKCIVDSSTVRFMGKQAQFQIDRLKALRAAFDNNIIAELKRHNGIPSLSDEELEFREALAAYLEVA